MVTDWRPIIQLGIAVLVAVALSYAVNDYRQAKHDAAIGEQRGEVLATASAGVDDGVSAAEVQGAIDAAIASGRTGFNKSISEAKKNEPETAVRADRPVPASVRRAYAERRRARERSGCAGSECEGEREAGAAAER